MTNKRIFRIMAAVLLFVMINITNAEIVFCAPADVESLSINCGDLVPEFSPDIYEYEVYVTADQDNKDCRVNAKTKDQSAGVTVEGPAEFSDDDIQRKVVVSKNGRKTSEYIIDVHIVKEYEKLLKGNLYTPASRADVKLLPTGFESTKVDYKGNKIAAAENKEQGLTMVQYVNSMDEKDVIWYMYDSENGKLYQSDVKDIDGGKYILVSAGKSLMYGSNDGDKGYCLYDNGKGIIEPLEAEGRQSHVMMLIYAIAIILTLLLCVIIYKILKKGKREKIKMSTDTKYFRPYLSLDEEENRESKKGDMR